MIDVLSKHLPPSVVEAAKEDFDAVTRLLVRGTITVDEAAIARERLADKLKDQLGIAPVKLRVVA